MEVVEDLEAKTNKNILYLLKNPPVVGIRLLEFEVAIGHRCLAVADQWEVEIQAIVAVEFVDIDVVEFVVAALQIAKEASK